MSVEESLMDGRKVKVMLEFKELSESQKKKKSYLRPKKKEKLSETKKKS